MKSQLAFALFLTLLPASAHAAGPRALVAVENPPPGAAAQLLADDVMVVRDLERYLLVAADAHDFAALDRAALTYRVLDPAIDGKTYYTVGYRGTTRLPHGDDLRILRDDGREAVIEASPEAAEAVSALGMDIARVFIRPIRAAHATAIPRPRTTEWDSEVQSIVDAVQGANVNAHVQRLQNFVTRHSTTDSCLAAANWIRTQFQSCGIDSVVFHSFSPTYRPNVVAVLPGLGDPTKQVVIGGHYDSTAPYTTNCPGADDDASGTACVLECARVLASHQFNYTIVFVAFCAEEQGLIGSEAYAAAAQARGDDIVAMIAVDMIGYLAAGDLLDLDVIDNPASAWLNAVALEMGPLYVPALPIVEGAIPGGASSDHASFWAHGYDAILFFEDTGNYSPYIHTTSDVVGTSYNSPALAERSVKAAAALVATVAQTFHVSLAHTPLTDTTDTTNPYRVTAHIVALEALVPGALLVHWTSTFGSGTETLTPTGVPEEYEAFIPAQPGGSTVSYWLEAEDVSGHRATSPSDAPAGFHSFFVGTITTVWADDFETDRGWLDYAPGDYAISGFWERADPNGTYAGTVMVQPEDDHTPAPGVICWITGNAPGTNQATDDVDGGRTTLTSPVIDLSGQPNAHLRYYRWYTNDTGAAPGLDVWTVDVSSDGGTVWTRIETLMESDRSWRLVDIDLEPFTALTSQMRFRFTASDEGAGSIVEAGVDDFSLVTYQEPATDAPLATAAHGPLSLAPSFPNPALSGTTISFTVPLPERSVSLRVYDLAGRLVATLVNDEEIAGRRVVTWNGTDDAGRDVAAGVYFYRLAAGEETLSRKLVLIR